MDGIQKRQILWTGVIGIAAALIVCVGEYLLHYDALARYSETSYEFLLASTDNQQTIGHFFGVLAAPLYLVGCWHMYLMLKPANQKLSFAMFVLTSYGFIMGAVWISSRASIGAITHLEEGTLAIEGLVDLYQIRYETLLSIIRITTLVSSIIFVRLVLTGNTYYKKWQSILNPILLLLISFLIYLILPTIGKHMMPVALNIGFGVFFIMSTLQARTIKVDNKYRNSITGK